MKKLILSICGTNCYILYDESLKEGIIIDPAASPSEIDDAVKRIGVNIRGIFLTHGHFDHIGAAKSLKERYKVSIYAHKDEAELCVNGMLNLSAVFGTEDSVNVDVLLNDGQIIEACGFKITVIHTPGHTKGSCCYLIEDDEKVRLFSGDTLFCQSHGRTDFPTGSERQIYESIVEKLLVLDGAMEVYSGHGESTTIEDEKKWYRR